MKRIGNLYTQICAFENLLLAARKAQRCKRYKNDVLAFNYDLEPRLARLQKQLIIKTYQPGAYKTFVIYEPKRRLISAAPYADRVVHHALYNIIEPIFDACFIESSYANRRGKGTHKALEHFQRLSRRYRYCLRADIEQYFPSMDHAVLKERIRRKIKCHDTLWLADSILDNSNEQEPVGKYFMGDDLLTPCMRRHGLPIGNLTSQLWANVYLDGLDHLMAAQFGGRRYLRYVDDIAVFSDSREELTEARLMLAELTASIRLRLHPVKTAVTEMRHGVNFLGFRFFPDRIRVRQENLRRARSRLKTQAKAYGKGVITVADLHNSIQSWITHVSFGDTWRIRDKIFTHLVFAKC